MSAAKGGPASVAENKVEKYFIGARELLADSFRLGMQVYESGFRPNFIVGIWRGGSPVGIAVQELLDYFGVETDHIAIRTSLYAGINERRKRVRVHGLGYVLDNIDHEDSLLIVDDVWDSGRSIKAVIDKLKIQARRNAPDDIRVATVYFKPSMNKVKGKPDYFVHETDQWLVFPHELQGLSKEEILAKQSVEGIREQLEKHALKDA
ncbi:MAG: hypoxanthine phosphoribosyltransferase [Gammaproteobacteria bacterium]|nr:hypoxanthine phosphoribosyltransferase [Gammaproteobacteria bacterium]